MVIERRIERVKSSYLGQCEIGPCQKPASHKLVTVYLAAFRSKRNGRRMRCVRSSFRCRYHTEIVATKYELQIPDDGQ